MTRKSRKGFFLNTVILFAAMFITKGLGAVLKIPLANILGGEGMGYGNNGLPRGNELRYEVC